MYHCFRDNIHDSNGSSELVYVIDYLLIHPKIGQHGGDEFIPLGMMKIGSSIEDFGYNVEYWDGRCDDIHDLFDLLDNTVYGGVFFSSMSGSQYDMTRRMIDRIAHNTKHKQFRIGGYATQGKSYTVTKVGTNPNGTQFQYIIYYDNTRCDMQDPITEKTKRFYRIFKPLLFTSYGCPNHCLFCTVNGKWIPVPLEQIEKELKLIKECGHDYVTIGDPNFDHPTATLPSVLHVLKESGLKWHCNLSLNSYPLSSSIIIKAMKYAGCRSIEIGIESGSSRIRHMLTRKINSGRFVFHVNLELMIEKISPMYSFMVGVPTETRYDTLMTMKVIDNLHRQNPQARFSLYTYCSYPSALQRKYPEIVNFDMGKHPLYWITGLKFRKDNVRKNFRGWKRLLSVPFELWSEIAWKLRILKFPKRLFEKILKLVKR